jgi:AcrR family transcriptional regulator
VPAVKTTRKPASADLATRLVDEAGRVLSAQGAAALSLRRLAAATGTSTMSVYTLFGDKQGLLAAMYRAGFERLGAAMTAAVEAADEPLEALAELGYAYRRTALANPHLYDLMFGRPVATFEPTAGDRDLAQAAYRPLVDAVERCIGAGAMVPADAERVASYLWSVTHGTVSLELAGQLAADPAERDIAFTEALVFSSVPFLPPA